MQIISTRKNTNCGPIIAQTHYQNGITYDQIIRELDDLRSIIHKILLDVFAPRSDARESIVQMYDMIWSVIKAGMTDGLWVFTTNYDMVMEEYAYASGHEPVNGFVDDAHRSGVWAGKWVRRKDLPPLYLTKLHGSVNWHEGADGKIVETGGVTQRNGHRDVIIAPTEGVKDYSRKPFQD